MEKGERSLQGNYAGAAHQKYNIGLFDPAFGFVFFEFEFYNGFDGVTWRHQFEVITGEFVRDVFGAGECAVAGLVEAGADGVQGVREELIELDVEFVDGKAGLQSG